LGFNDMEQMLQDTTQASDDEICVPNHLGILNTPQNQSEGDPRAVRRNGYATTGSPTVIMGCP